MVKDVNSKSTKAQLSGAPHETENIHHSLKICFIIIWPVMVRIIIHIEGEPTFDFYSE